MRYKLGPILRETGTTESVFLIYENGSGLCIPFSPDNTDYQNFKKQINADKAELQDADGNTMSVEDAKAYVATLP